MVKDRFHDAVRTALEKDGWTITADPYELSVGGVDFEIDLAAEMLAAERSGEQIAVEVKSFMTICCFGFSYRPRTISELSICSRRSRSPTKALLSRSRYDL